MDAKYILYICCVIRDVVSSLMNSDSSFMEFKPQSPMDTLDDDDDNDDNGDEAFGLGKMFSS